MSAGAQWPFIVALLCTLAGCLDGTTGSAPREVTPRTDVFIHDESTILGDSERTAALPRFEVSIVPDSFGWEPTVATNSQGDVFVALESFENEVAGLSRIQIGRLLAGQDNWDIVDPASDDQLRSPTASLDPFVYVDPESDRLYALELRVDCLTLAWSDDQGTSWETNNLACGNPVEDHPSIWTLAVGGRTEIFICSNLTPLVAPIPDRLEGATVCKRSANPEGPFLQIGRPFGDEDLVDGCAGVSGHGIAWPERNAILIGKSVCGTPTVSISYDWGETWSPSPISSDTMSIVNHDVDIAVTGDSSVYAAYVTDEGLPRIVISHDAGKSWSAPLDILLPTQVQATALAVTAAPDGNVTWTYVATRSANSTNVWHQYVGRLIDEDTRMMATWRPLSTPVAIADIPGRAGRGGIGDYLDVTTSASGLTIASTAVPCLTSCEPVGPNGSIPRGPGGIIYELP